MDLTAEQRKVLLKMGDGSRGFVSKAQELVRQNSDFLPRSFDVEHMLRNMERWEAMEGMLLAINQLQELMDDTYGNPLIGGRPSGFYLAFLLRV